MNRSRCRYSRSPWLPLLLCALLFSGQGLLAVSPVYAKDDTPKSNVGNVNNVVNKADEDPEVKQGRQIHEEMIKSGLKLVKDPELLKRVETIGRKIADAANAEAIPASFGSSRFVRFEYHFFVVEDKDVNAFSLPGGYIYVNSGLLKYVQSDDELAGVLGHEVTHALHHHLQKLQHEQSRLSTQMLLGLLAAILVRAPADVTANLLTTFNLIAIQKVNGHSQNAERDADHGGVELARKAGYNPVGALTFMERLARDEKRRPDIDQGIYRTHPPSQERASAMISEIKEMKLPLNRRSVTNTLKVSVAPAPMSPVGATDVLLDGKLIYRSATPEGGQRVATLLNQYLDNNLEIREVGRNENSITLRGQTLFTLEPKEVTLLAETLPGQVVTVDTAVDQAYKTIRNALFKNFLNDPH